MKPKLALFYCLVAPLSGFAQQGEDNAFSVTSVLKHDEALARAHDVELQGDFAFVPGKGGSIAIINIADPADPKLIWFRRDEKFLGDAETVVPAGDWLFLGTNDFHSIDVSDPTHPRFAAVISKSPEVSKINGMARRGDLLFSADKDGWINAFDVSDPAKPRLAAAYETKERHGIGSPHDADLFGPYLVVVDPQRFGKGEKKIGKVALFRVLAADEQTLLPVSEWELTGQVITTELTGANRVQVSGDKAFVGGSESGKGSHFMVVDLADPKAPKQIASIPFTDVNGPNGLTLAGRVAFAAGGQTVESFDISNPAAPVRLAAQKFTEALPTGRDNAHDLVYRDGYLFVTGQNDNCLVILKVMSDRIRELADSR